jgi:hypothetical protein
MDLIDIFKQNVNSFAVVDFKTQNGSITAMGKLMPVSDDGYVRIINLKNKQISWGFNLKEVEVTSYKFSPIKKEEDDS